MQCSLHPDASHVEIVNFELVDDNHSVILSKEAKIGPNSPQPVLSNIKTKVTSNSQGEFMIRSSLSSTHVPAPTSKYSYSCQKFSIAAPPTDLSVRYSADTGSLTARWSPVADVDEYTIQIVDQDCVEVLTYTRTPKESTCGQSHDAICYSVPSSDIATLTPGKAYLCRVFSGGNPLTLIANSDASVLSGTINFLKPVENFYVEYNAPSDSIDVVFDSVSLAECYIVVVSKECESENTTKTIGQFGIPSNVTGERVKHFLPLTGFRDGSLGFCTYEFQVQAFGSASSIPSPCIKATKTWKVAEPPGAVKYSYDPNEDQLTVTCEPVRGFRSYKLIVQNETSGEKVGTISCDSPPQAQWEGKELKGCGKDKFVCMAQTVGRECVFSSTLCKCSSKLTKLDSVSACKTTFNSQYQSHIHHKAAKNC